MIIDSVNGNKWAEQLKNLLYAKELKSDISDYKYIESNYLINPFNE